MFSRLKIIVSILLFFTAVLVFLTVRAASNNWDVTIDNSHKLASINLEPILQNGFTVKYSAAGFSELIQPEEFKNWLSPIYRDYHQRTEYLLIQNKVELKLENIAKKINRLSVNAVFGVNSNNEIYEKIPAQFGYELDNSATIQAIYKAINDGNNVVELSVIESQPEISLAKLKQLEIDSLLGQGISNFSGSPNARAHNIKIGSKIFNGLTLAPGTEFSFNQQLGEVTASTGYQPELVIKGDKLIPEYGGGLCQISTTLFRAIMTAGLPILERHPHSMPVRYYNPQGFDATIYPGVSDLRFKNDTTANVFIQTEINGGVISFEIFGQKDGRIIDIKGPIVYESSPDGSMKTWLERIITQKDGTQTKDMFYSSYKSPSTFETIRNPYE